MRTFKAICVYVDADYNVYSNPHAIDRSGITSNCLYSWDVLMAPYDNDTLEAFLLESLEHSFTEEVKWTGISPEEIFFKAKSWRKAIKGLRFVEVMWSHKDGYTIIPSKWEKSHKGHWSGIYGAYPEKPRDDGLKYYDDLGKHPEKGAIARAFLRAVELSSPA